MFTLKGVQLLNVLSSDNVFLLDSVRGCSGGPVGYRHQRDKAGILLGFLA